MTSLTLYDIADEDVVDGGASGEHEKEDDRTTNRSQYRQHETNAPLEIITKQRT
jgi:hypothetical protein